MSATITARNNILAKLHRQVAGADYSKLPEEPNFDYPKMDRQQQLAQFVTELENNHAQVIKTRQQDINQVVEQTLKSLDISTLLYGTDSQYSPDIEMVGQQITLQPFDFEFEGDAKNNLFNHMPAGITGSHSAIAATGTIVLWPTVNEPRVLSLVPPVHIVIVDADTLVDDLATLIKTQQWQNQMPTNILLISGPSKTADIQQTLAYGAHGPKELIVLLINAN